jgi:predicted Zn-dependent protease
MLRAGGMQLRIPEKDARIEAAGFNLDQVRLSWHMPEGEFAFFIDGEQDRARFVAQAPASLTAGTAGVEQRRRGVAIRFHAALLVYGTILALPLLLLGLFLLNTDRLAGRIAEKVPVSTEEKIGALVLAQARAQTQLTESGPAYDAVKVIGTMLTEGSPYRYRWFVANEEQVNAFAAPGGIVVVYAGLIRQAARAEELAGILAHEVAHVEQRHALTNLVKNAGFVALLSLALGDWSGTASSAWIAKFTELKFSRDAETEADTQGLRRMTRAGIAPQYMADFFGRLAQEEGRSAQVLSILATHPPSRERMHALRQQIAMLPQRQYAPLPVDWQAVQASLRLAQSR